MTKRLPLAPDPSEAAAIVSPLPPLYAAWIGELLGGALPDEPHATCGRCAMVAADGAPAGPGEVRFDRETKCCTYEPLLASFLVGRILRAGDDALGAGALRARIALREGVTPLGIEPTAAARDRYTEASAAGAFGRAPELLCPHFRRGDGFNCAVWAHRNATCSTWFCKHERGAKSATFWKRLRDMLALVEARLSRWCALEVGIGDAALAELIGTSDLAGERRAPDAGGASARYRSIWGDWAGREEAYYIGCATAVEALAWHDVERICGADATLDARLVRQALGGLAADAEAPREIRLGDVDVGPPDDDGFVVVRGYSEYDPLVLPAPLLDALRSVDGRPTDDALAALRERRVVLEPDLLAALVDFEILKV